MDTSVRASTSERTSIALGLRAGVVTVAVISLGVAISHVRIVNSGTALPTPEQISIDVANWLARNWLMLVLLWFAVFPLFEAIPVSGRVRERLACTLRAALRTTVTGLPVALAGGVLLVILTRTDPGAVPRAILLIAASAFALAGLLAAVGAAAWKVRIYARASRSAVRGVIAGLGPLGILVALVLSGAI